MLLHRMDLTDLPFNRVIFRARQRFRERLEHRGFAKSDLLALALASGLVAVVLGAWLWMAPRATTPMVGALVEVADANGHSIPLANTLILARTRGVAPAVAIPFPEKHSAIELRMLSTSRTPNERYRVTLSLVHWVGADSPVGKVQGLRASKEGFVTAYLDTAHLQPGRYALEMLPEQRSATGRPPDRFVIELR